MMNRKRIIHTGTILLMILLITACTKDKNQDNEPFSGELLTPIQINELPADPSTRDLNTGEMIGEDNRYTFFRFSDSTVVLYDSVTTDRSDSASTKWDMAFRGTDIILNNGIYGPGHVTGQIVLETFDHLHTAPKKGYKEDTETGNVFANWYNYNPQNHVISSKPRYLFIIHTNDDKYVKMQILDYYKDRPTHPTVESHQRYYTFRYVIGKDGSRKFYK